MIADTIRDWNVEFTDKEGINLLGTVKIEAINLDEAWEKAKAYESVVAPKDWTFAHVGLNTVVNIGHGLENLY